MRYEARGNVTLQARRKVVWRRRDEVTQGRDRKGTGNRGPSMQLGRY
jgi:hypothetical protein